MPIAFHINIAPTQLFNNTWIEWYEFQQPMLDIVKEKTLHCFPKSFSKMWDRLEYMKTDWSIIEYDLYAKFNTKELSIEYMVMLSYPIDECMPPFLDTLQQVRTHYARWLYEYDTQADLESQ